MSGQRLADAVALATELHEGQRRKGTSIPYLSHLLSVAALVMEDGGDDDQVAAALLHDAAEDQGGEDTLAMIAERFGARVAGIVRDCSDSLLARGEQKAPWQERKSASIAHLETVDATSLIVVAADKLHNVRSTLYDVTEHGPVTWTRFKTGREGFVWYHEEVLRVLVERIPTSRSVGQLETLMAALRAG